MTGNVKVQRAALAGALVLVLAACGGASSSPGASAAGGGGGASPAPATQAAASQAAASQAAASQGAASEAPAASAGSGATSNAIAALSDLNSYKLKLAIASKGTTSGIAAMGNISMAGIVVAKPAKASDITMTLGGGSPEASGTAMALRMVEVGGKNYIDLGTGLTESTDSSQSSTADSLSPEKLLGGMSSYLSQMQAVGDERKNGVATTHYQADTKLLGGAASALSMLGLTDAKWSWDVWLAKEGGYAVSYIMKGTGGDGAELSISLDISDANSPSNVVKGP